ncbi:hypothetical protein JMJ35_001108 [Cladonia borealis]|uniref:Uncharacterized protein n=1 Tax=Cladonia borealis TaxID=184061 RepID=A0AA39R7Y5_9LECA|nr:hypothetical protein JMJ35_001108 [Cladonia borealis]
MHATVFSIFFAYLYAVAFTSATAAASTSPSGLAPATSSIALNVTGTVSKPVPKPYHVPNTPTTLFFTDYKTPPGLAAPSVYQSLVKALHAVYHNAQPPNSGSSSIGFNTISWSSGGVTLLIENYGTQGTKKLTWTILADTILGVATFLENEGCLDSEWTILDATWGNIGSGYIGSDTQVAGGNVSAAAPVEAA